MPDAAVTFSAKRVSHVYNQAHDFMNLTGNFNHDTDLSIEQSRPANMQRRMAQLPEAYVCTY